MLKCNKLSWLLVIPVVLSTVLQETIIAQEKKCLFISEEIGPHEKDIILVDWLDLKYDVTITTGDEVKTHTFTIEDFKQYDFIFVSESISSSDTKDLKGAPVPIFYTELWSAKWDVAGWVPANISGTYYENTPENEVIIVNGDHPLAAGFPVNTSIIISSATDDPNHAILTYAVPQIEYIPIAVLAADETKVVVMGVEKGTALYNAENVIDGSLVSESRCAAVGINHTSNNYITEEGFALIDAGIQWILEDESGIEKEQSAASGNFSLIQNYPNPFNPATSISFTLTKADHTSLIVHNTCGQLVDTIIDQNMAVGTYEVQFEPKNLPSGIYFYQIRSGEFMQTRQMIYLK